MRILKKVMVGLIALLAGIGNEFAQGQAQWGLHPVTREVHVSYVMPADVPDEVVVTCSWSAAGKSEWRPARVRPLVSETALELASDEQWREWGLGRIVERRAGGLDRTVVWNPYPEAVREGKIDADLRFEISEAKSPQATDADLKSEISNRDGKKIAEFRVHVQTDFADVVYLEDWTKVLQAEAVRKSADAAAAGGRGPNADSAGERGWEFRTHVGPDKHVSRGDALYGTSEPNVQLTQLTYPLDLKGWYAIFVATEPGAGSPGIGSIRLRLSGDEAADTLGSRRVGEEVFWKWARLDRQNLVLKQPHLHTGYVPAHIDYVKLVPLTQKQVDELEGRFGKPDKLVAGYWEPYSWAFNEDIQTPMQHREPLSAFAWARIGLVDTQLGRVGMKVVYESRATDPLVYGTFGDPIEGCPRPVTTNVGRMQQYSNTLGDELRYARELGLNMHANFGAGACYNGTPLQGDISKQHPDWRRGNTLRYELPEVRAYALRLFREALEIGAPGISIDFCRYPEGVDNADTGNTLIRELRKLADEFASRAGGERVPILVRFPGAGVRLHDRFDYRTWAREGLVDYLCPGNLQGRHMHIDMMPYLDAVRGTSCQLLPAMDGLTWGLPMPGPFLWRVRQLYEAGVPGIYVYQADARVLGRPAERRWMRMLASSEAVRQWWERQERDRPRCTKGIYLSRPEAPGGAYHGYERLRIWTEGMPAGPVEIYLDGKLATTCSGPPYLLGTEGYESDKLIAPGRHILKVRAKDGEGWLEQQFEITGG